MYFIIAGNTIQSPRGGINYTSLRVAAKCETIEEVRERIYTIYSEASGLIMVIDEHGNEHGLGDPPKPL